MPEDFAIKQEQYELLRQQAEFAYGNNDLNTALVLFREALQFEVNKAECLSNIAKVYISLTELDTAEYYLLKALQEDKDSYKALVNFGLLQYKKNEYNKAIIYYEKALRVNPNIDGILSNIGNTYAKLQNYQLAEEYHLKACEIGKNSLISQYNLGCFYYKVNRFQEAVNILAPILDMVPKTHQSDVFFLLSESYFNLNKFDDAILYYIKLIDRCPKEVYYYWQVVIILKAQKKYTQAIEYLIKILEFDRGNQAVWENLVLCCVNSSSHPKARLYAKEAIAYLPDSEYILFQNSHYFYLDKEYEQALMLIEKALLFDPYFPAYQNLLGLIYYQMNELIKAYEAFELVGKKIEQYSSDFSVELLEESANILRVSGDVLKAELFDLKIKKLRSKE